MFTYNTIFPCNADKKPLTPHGFKDASDDPDVQENWKRTFKNIVYWGYPTGDGIFVVDVDCKNGGIGLKNWKEMIQAHGEPNTYTVQTRSGGYHYYFYMPSGTVIYNSTSKFADGIDIRGQGGYVIVPDGIDYEVVKDADVAYPPLWILEHLGMFSNQGTIGQKKNIEFKMPVKVKEGERNDLLFRSACSMRAKGYSDSAVLAATMAENKEKCDPELDESEVEKIVESAIRYDGKAPIKFDEDAFTLSDVGNARRMVAKYGDILRYCPSLGWMIWNGRYWELDKLNHIRVLAMNTIYSIYGEAEKAQDKKIGDWARTSQSGSHIDTMIKNASALLAIDMNEFDKFPETAFLLNLRNGVLNLKTGKLEPHNREYLLSRYTDIDFDEKSECPKWEAFIEKILPDADKRWFVQKSLGYSLSASTDGQAWFLCHGVGANGKTTLLEAMADFLGSTICKQIPIDALMDNGRGQSATPYTVGMFRQRMIISTEIPSGKSWNDGIIKIISGERKVVGRNLYKDPFEFDFTAKLWISGNNKPEVKDKSDGFWRKVKLIGFDVIIPVAERRPMSEILAEFKEEHSGMLNWLLKGCMAWQSEGLIEPESVKAATMEYRSEEDILQQFINESCIIGDDLSEDKSELLKRLNVYLTTLREDNEYSMTKLSRELAQKGIPAGGVGRKKYMGIALKPREEQSPTVHKSIHKPIKSDL